MSTRSERSGLRSRQNQGGRNGPPLNRMRRFWGPSDRLAMAGNVLALIQPDDDGLRLYHARTGSLLHDLKRPGRIVTSVLASQAGERLLTIERLGGPRGRPDAGPRPPSLFPAASEAIEITLWDLNRLDQPMKILDRIPIDPHRATWLVPAVAAFSPDGKTVAIASNKATTYTVALYAASSGEDLGTIDTQSEMLSSLALGEQRHGHGRGQHNSALGPRGQNVPRQLSPQPEACTGSCGSTPRERSWPPRGEATLNCGTWFRTRSLPSSPSPTG